MSAHACLLAAADLSAEPEIVRLLQASGIHVRRRCLDAADLLAAAWVDPQVPVVLSAVLPRLTRECITRLQAQDRLVLGLAHDSAHEQQLRDWGIADVLLADEPAAVVSLLAVRLASAPAIQRDTQGPGVWTLGPPAAAAPVAPAAQPPSRTPVDHEPRAMPHRRPGAITAVWGPDGAPGRSTTALAVGAALAAAGSRTLVIDADTTAPALALLTGVIEDASGILVSARYAAQGLLTPGALATIARPVTQECALLGGIAHGRRWRELRPESLIGVLDVAQQCFDAVIVDVA
ncbi:MAG: hypothetical protein PHU75_12210, partial [Candidatus Nanopelagicales bacterium]|nr:hypothetical protein [Candidatus Nanopelagicales bacterium]